MNSAVGTFLRYSGASAVGSPQGGLFIAMMHYIARPPLNAPFRGLFLSPPALAHLFNAIRAAGIQTVSPNASRDFGPSARGKRLALTFDDAAASIVEAALPELVRHAFIATTFVVAGKIGGWNDWDLGLGACPVRLADTEQLRDWLAAKQRIGSHGLTHRSLLKLSPDEARREIFDSKAKLEDQFGISVEDFCYPYGDLNGRIADLVAEAGYRTACSVKPGMNLASANPYALCRYSLQHRRAWLAAISPSFLSARC